MKPQEKTRSRIQIATRAIIAALEHFNEQNPGKCIIKKELLPHAARRASWIMEDDEDPIYDQEAIGAPTINFIQSRWSDICLVSADEYKKYIIWEPRKGVRLGERTEYEDTRKILAEIAKGLVDNVESRDRIIVKQGGSSFLIDIRIRQLGPGDNGNSSPE